MVMDALIREAREATASQPPVRIDVKVKESEKGKAAENTPATNIHLETIFVPSRDRPRTNSSSGAETRRTEKKTSESFVWSPAPRPLAGFLWRCSKPLTRVA